VGVILIRIGRSSAMGVESRVGNGVDVGVA